jgi:hypothetical protein
MVFTPDFAAVDAGFPLYDKDMYRVKITDVTPLVYEKTDRVTKDVSNVIRIRCKLEMFGRHNGDDLVTTDQNDKEIRGKNVQAMDVYTHSEGGWSFAKGFLMAACGFSMKEENEANTELFQAGDWACPDDPTQPESAQADELGESWSLLVDRLVDVYLQKETRTGDDGIERENQKMSAWQPVGDRAI